MKIPLLLTAALMLAAPALARAEDQLILHGERIGPVSLGMSESQVLEALGEPASSFPVQEGEVVLFFDHPDLGVTLVDQGKDGHRIVDAVSTDSAEFADAHGIRVGSSSSDVIAAYGSGYELSDDEGTRILWYHDAGIRFDFGPAGDAVNAIEVSLSRAEFLDAP